MEMPTLPTDNLYKFIAIAGLLLFAGTIYYPTMLEINTHEQYVQVSESIELLKADTKDHKVKIEQFTEIISNSILQQKGQYTNSTDKITLLYSDAEIKQMRNDILELNHQDSINLAKLESSNSQLNFLISMSKKVFFVQIVLLFISGLAITFGFKLWYNRIQKYIAKK